MFTSTKISLKIKLVAIILLIFAMATPFAKVRSIRSRELLNDPEIVTTQYAKISPASLLANSILRITILNDQTGDAELKVAFSITIDVPADASAADQEWDGTMTINLYPTIPSGDSMTIDNTTIMNNLESYMNFGFDGFTGDFGTSHSTSPGSMDFSNFDISDTAELSTFIGEVLNLPEGDYTIAFHIYERDYDNTDDPNNYDVDRGEEDVTFKVVNIGGMSIDTYPTIGDRYAIEWSLPEVPNYQDTRKTTSTLSITGSGVNFSKAIPHGSPSGTGLKGYPGGTDEGLATYDLSADSLNFRAGASYTLTIRYTDWNGAEIAQEKTRTFSFPTASVSYDAPDLDDTWSPELSWSFGDYENDDWVESYDVYLGSTKLGNTEDTSYTISDKLNYGTRYAWHVVPRYASDRSAFSLSGEGAFTTQTHQAPEVSVDTDLDGAVMFKNETYTFEASAEAFDDEEITVYRWTIGSTTLNGDSVEYTPTRDYSSLAINCRASDSAGVSTTSASQTARVITPNFSISAGSPVEIGNTYTAEATGLPIEPDSITWAVTGPSSDSGSGTTFSPSFNDTTGTYTITATAVFTDSFDNETIIEKTARITVTANPDWAAADAAAAAAQASADAAAQSLRTAFQALESATAQGYTSILVEAQQKYSDAADAKGTAQRAAEAAQGAAANHDAAVAQAAAQEAAAQAAIVAQIAIELQNMVNTAAAQFKQIAEEAAGFAAAAAQSAAAAAQSAAEAQAALPDSTYAEDAAGYATEAAAEAATAQAAAENAAQATSQITAQSAVHTASQAADHAASYAEDAFKKAQEAVQYAAFHPTTQFDLGEANTYDETPIVIQIDASISDSSVMNGMPVTVSLAIENISYVDTLTWKLDGNTIESGASPTDSREFTARTSGSHVVTVTAVPYGEDLGVQPASTAVTFTSYPEPALSIASPNDGASYGPTDRISLSGALANTASGSIVYRYYWEVDGEEVDGIDSLSATLPPMAPGEHEIGLSAVAINGRTYSSDTVGVRVQSDLILSLMAPADQVTIIEGQEITCRVSARTLSTVVPVSRLVDEIYWYVNGSDSGSSGLSYQFSESSADSYEIMAVYAIDGQEIESNSVTVNVIAFDAPTITAPAADTIYYNPGGKLQFTGEGADQATFTWKLDSTIIGRRKAFQYDPAGKDGSYTLTLTASYLGEERETSRTISLRPNNPPEVTLTAEPAQYVGTRLSFTAGAVDDHDGTLSYTTYLDGRQVSSGQTLTSAQVGLHTLRVTASDSMGLTSQKQVSFTVKSGITGVNLLAPKDNTEVYPGKSFRLFAALEGDFSLAPSDLPRWNITKPDGSGETVQGFDTSFTPTAEGDYTVAFRYLDSVTGTEWSEDVTVSVIPEPVNLSIYWPHGELVNAGAELNPELVGTPPAGVVVTWYLDESDLPNSTFIAPETAGTHTLAIRSAGEEFDMITFEVNAAPEVTISSADGGTQYLAGSPIVLTAAASDDQSSPQITWTNAAGTVLGSRNVLTLSNLTNPAAYTFTATAADQYGLEGSASVTLNIIQPAAITSGTVNNGYKTFLVENGNTILVTAAVSGGIAPSVSWTLKQGSTTARAAGTTSSLNPSGFSAGPATIELSVTDAGTVQTTRSFPIQLITEASAAIVTPVPNEILWAADTQQFTLNIIGITANTITAEINGDGADSTLQSMTQSDDGKILEVVVDVSTASLAEGVYKLAFDVSDGQTTRTVTYDMNIFERQPGITISGAPASYDLRSGTSVELTADLFALEGASVDWYTAAAAEPVGTGTTLDLAALSLTPGQEQITAAAVDGSGNVLAQTSVPLAVTGPVTLAVNPPETMLTVTPGADFVLQATASDTDGTELSGEAISWNSQLDGTLGTGAQFIPGSLPNLTTGDHILTVTATGKTGEQAQYVLQLIVREEEGPPPEQTGSQGGAPIVAPAPLQTVFTSAVPMTSSVSQPVSTAIIVNGNIWHTRGDDKAEKVTQGLTLFADDIIEVRANNNKLTVIVTSGSVGSFRSVTLTRGTYHWDATSSAWVAE